MKKTMRSIGLVLASAVVLSSCTLVHTAVVTNNPVGTKKGELKTSIFGTKTGVSYFEAMKKGRITKVGIAEYKMKSFIIFPVQYFTVTGE